MVFNIDSKVNKYIRNRKTLSSLLLLATLLISVNQLTIKSSIVGFCASVIYLLVGGYFIGDIFLEKEQLMMRLSLGVLILLAILGLLGWFFIISYKLGIIEAIIALIVATSFLIFYPSARSLILRRFKRT